MALADQLVADGGHGRDAQRLGACGRGLCRKLAEAEPNERKRQRLLEAECGKNWVNRVLHDRTNVVAAGGTMAKQGMLSEARARAKDPRINKEMFRRIAAQYAQDYKAGHSVVTASQ